MKRRQQWHSIWFYISFLMNCFARIFNNGKKNCSAINLFDFYPAANSLSCSSNERNCETLTPDRNMLRNACCVYLARLPSLFNPPEMKGGNTSAVFGQARAVRLINLLESENLGREEVGEGRVIWVKRTISTVSWFFFLRSKNRETCCPIVIAVYEGVNQWSTSSTRQSTECKSATNRVSWLGDLFAGRTASITSSPGHCQLNFC